jgi:DNA helicase-2/ATP-dependent DNA helicase PcrA
LQQFTRDQVREMTKLAKASPLQDDIFMYFWDELQKYAAGQSTESLMVQAVAGSGKTTTIVAASRLIKLGYRALFLAFNKSIATELQQRLPRNIEAKTLNALGFAMWTRYFRGVHRGSVELKAYKTNEILRNLFSKNEIKAYGDDVRFLVGMCKSMGLTPAGIQGVEPINGNYVTAESLLDICHHFGRNVEVPNRPTVFRMVEDVLRASLTTESVIDFDDQKYMSVVKRPGGSPIPAEKYDVIIIDEVQDVNAVDMALIKMSLKPRGIVIGVGDSNQAIYGFRGADTRSVENFKAAFNANELPLSITYRCGKNIVKLAQEIVPSIQAADTAVDGEVKELGVVPSSTFQPDDLIICRNNAPTISYAFKLIRDRVPVVVRGRDIGKNLINLIERLCGTEVWVDNPRQPGKKMKAISLDGVSTAELTTQVKAWMETQIALIMKDNPDDEAAVQKVQDMGESVLVFTEANTDNKAISVVADIQSLFDTTGSDENGTPKGKVVLSTVHKAKGTEADRVFILDKDLFFPKYVRRGTWQWDQESNLVYVAYTRAKSLLGFIWSDEEKADEQEGA